jgi:hypothetical protein
MKSSLSHINLYSIIEVQSGCLKQAFKGGGSSVHRIFKLKTRGSGLGTQD